MAKRTQHEGANFLMNKELEALNEIFENYNVKSFAELNERLCDYNELKFDDDIRQKKLKALEIIKDLLFTIFDEIAFNDEKNEILFSDHYGVVFTRQYKNKETYDLLKEALE